MDICHLFISPSIVGDSKKALPSGIRLTLTLQDERRFGNGMIFLQYRSAQLQAI